MKASRGAGDRGKTSLFSGERVTKAHALIEACGELDELNSVLGGLVSAMPADQTEIVRELKEVQSALFVAGALLGTTPSSPSSASLAEIASDRVKALETATDRIHAGLPKLTGFVIPGGHESASWAHLARAVCRRAERRAVALADAAAGSDPDPQLGRVVVYLNRLSDYLFCVARHNNKVTGTAEEIWKK